MLTYRYLEDHPRTRKWLITMVIVVINGGDPNHLLTDDPPSTGFLI